MRKLFLSLFCIPLLFLLSGCVHVQSDITIEDNLSGKWKAKISSESPISTQDIRSKLDQAGITDYQLEENMEKISTQHNGRIEEREVPVYLLTKSFANANELTDLRNKFQDIFGTHPGDIAALTVDPENPRRYHVTLGNSNSKTQVTVPGKIIPESVSKGAITNDHTVVFYDNTPVQFRFEKSAWWQSYWVWGSGILLLVALGGIYFFRKK